jgi:threonine dehydrogenase-like Zn-dependent dehydrogenase
MCVGEVTELGEDVGEFRLGQKVAGYGGIREEHVWDANNTRTLPQGVPWQAAVCLDPANFALGAIRDGHVRLDDAVAVFGMGAIGLMAVQFAKIAGAFPVIAVEPVPLRQNIAAKCGADLVFDPTTSDAGLEIKKATDRRGADVSIEYSGHSSALQAAIRGAAYGSNVVCGAWAKPFDAGLDFGSEAHFNRVSIVFTRSCSEPNPDHPSWDEDRLLDVAWCHLMSGVVSCEKVVTPMVRFDELAQAYPKIVDPTENVKIEVEFS